MFYLETTKPDEFDGIKYDRVLRWNGKEFVEGEITKTYRSESAARRVANKFVNPRAIQIKEL